MKSINILKKSGSFAENKDYAREIRIKEIIPALEKGQEVIINFEGVEAVTQSFIHVLISDLFRKYGAGVLDRVSFKSCNDAVKKMIQIVVDYMQEGALEGIDHLG